MSTKNSLKNATPHILAFIIALVITVAFYHPLFLENKSFNQNDVFQGNGAAQEIAEFREETGKEALWTNSMFGGMPAYLISVNWSDGALTILQTIISLNMPSAAQVTFVSMLSFYILLLVFGVRPYLALAGAIAYGLGTFGIISLEAGHIFKVRAMAFIPLVLAGVHLIFHGKKKLIGITLSSVAVALEIKANHPQITYYLFLFFIFYGVNELWFAFKEDRLPQLFKNASLLLIAIVLGVGSNFGKLMGTMEYSKFSTRGKSELTQTNAGKNGLDRDYVFNWSHGVAESFTLLVPNFYGGASVQSLSDNSNLGQALKGRGLDRTQIKQQLDRVPTYHGEQPSVAGPVYAGAIICFLFILGALLLEKKYSIYLIAASVFFLILAWGKNFSSFNYQFYDFFPGYNKFRSVSMAMAMVTFILPLLGILGLEKLLSEGLSKSNIKKVKIAAGIVGGILLFFAVGAGAFNYSAPIDAQLQNFPDWFIKAIQADRLSLRRTDSLRSLFLIVAFLSIVYFKIKGKLSEKIFITLIIVLIGSDLWLVDRRYVNDDNFEPSSKNSFFKKTQADELILKDPATHFRVFNLLNPWNEARTSYFHSSIGGYHGAKMKRYQELIDYCLNNELQSIITQLQSGSLTMQSHFVTNMLNAKYLKFGDTPQGVVQNREAFGAVWLAGEVVAVGTADEEISETCELRSKESVVINTKSFTLSQNSYSTEGSISLDSYEPNRLSYSFTGSQKSLAIFSDIYYPKGWVATVDGVPAQIIQANYVLRALEIPEGEHKIEFIFKPTPYVIGDKIMLICSILTVFGFVGAISFSILKK